MVPALSIPFLSIGSVEQAFHVHRKFIVTEFSQGDASERAKPVLRQGRFSRIENPRKPLPRKVRYVVRAHHFP